MRGWRRRAGNEHLTAVRSATRNVPPAPLVSIGIVTWNSAADIDRCLEAVRSQGYQSLEVLVADNASTDGTVEKLESMVPSDNRLAFTENRGFAAAHNALIRRSRGEFYLCLNPDVELEPAYVSTLIEALQAAATCGSATGKLLRKDDPATIDSTGIVMLPSQRHLDRGAGERDDGRYGAAEEVFGVSGAAALYRRAMLDDTSVMGEFFDEDFFAYREDADLAWRAQLLGWCSIFVPQARARHGRRVTPERRGALPAAINRYSVRNRFLLRIKNQPPGHLLRFLPAAAMRDLQVVGYVLLREWSSFGGLVDVIRLLPRTWRKRRIIMRRRVMSSAALARWFSGDRAR